MMHLHSIGGIKFAVFKTGKTMCGKTVKQAQIADDGDTIDCPQCTAIAREQDAVAQRYIDSRPNAPHMPLLADIFCFSNEVAPGLNYIPSAHTPRDRG